MTRTWLSLLIDFIPKPFLCPDLCFSYCSLNCLSLHCIAWPGQPVANPVILLWPWSIDNSIHTNNKYHTFCSKDPTWVARSGGWMSTQRSTLLDPEISARCSILFRSWWKSCIHIYVGRIDEHPCDPTRLPSLQISCEEDTWVSGSWSVIMKIYPFVDP